MLNKLAYILFVILLNQSISFSQPRDLQNALNRSFETLKVLGVNIDSTLKYSYEFLGQDIDSTCRLKNALEENGLIINETSYTENGFKIIAIEETKHNSGSLTERLKYLSELSNRYGLYHNTDYSSWSISAINSDVLLNDQIFTQQLRNLENDSLFYRANKLMDYGYITRAAIAFELCIERSFNLDTSYLKLAGCYQIKGNLQKAIDNYNLALKYNKNYTQAYVSLGYLDYNGDYKKTISYFQKVEELDPNNKLGNNENVFLRMGIIYFDHQDYKNSKHYFEKTLQINPSNQTAKTYLMHVKLKNQ